LEQIRIDNAVDQIRKDNDMPPADLWRRAVRRGHGASLRTRLATCKEGRCGRTV